ncbi:hypothetical protein SERLA73DRAFT_149177 [Serpula lacrymans var. lacrymans S7.3]|uniref:Uncharacterized protein n=1 Tax=Serpula lacrymans var. lacrymans (strain S7.3) TaxID=936435 RepID=F8PGA9_SERL3|nr:hypothetical protein SERLA73DRAFT_149177 [Serpula lacrymans var. lacrymans S7.3]
MACGDKVDRVIHPEIPVKSVEGKWGKHIWPLLLTVLAENGNKGHMARNMQNVLRSPGLKHFMNVTTVEYADGQCILPRIVQILPKNSTLHISNDYKKDFHFSKQHAINHILTEIRQKGATDNYNTRVSEGFHQEAQEAYKQTNRKDTDSQMDCIDENQEAIAHIRMTVDNHDKAHHNDTEDQDLGDDAGSNDDQRSTQPTPNNHWILLENGKYGAGHHTRKV